MRGRSLAAAALGAIALVGSLLVATPAQALNDTGTGGVFMPASGRVLDTAVGTGGYTTPMQPSTYRTVKVAGMAGIPDDGSVGAVSLNATVSGTDSYGTLFGRPDADTSRTMMLIYNGTAGEYVSNSAIVAVSSEGTIQIATETSARLILDVQGYYTANDDGTAAGGFASVAGKRIVDTRSGLGATKATLAPGNSIDIQVAGNNGVPTDASAAVVNLLPINTTSSDGYLTAYATGTTRPSNALHYAPSTNTSMQAQVPLSADGMMTIYNGSSTINLVVDLQGYFTAAGATGATFTPGTGRVYDSRATGNTILAKSETRSIQVTSRAGVPVVGSGISAVVLTLTAYHPGSDGRATVWADGTDRPDTTSINFRNNEIRTNTVTLPVGANGKISLINVAAATHYLIDVQGWYTNPQSPNIACAGPYVAGSNGLPRPDAPISCQVTAPAASASGQFLRTSTDWSVAQEAPLSDTSITSTSLSVPEKGGDHLVFAQVVDDEGHVLATTRYAFTNGEDWSNENLLPNVADGTTAFKNATLDVRPENDQFPDTVVTTFRIWESNNVNSTPVWTSDGAQATAAIPDGLLSAGQTYYWNATVSGASVNASGLVTRTTNLWKFTASESQIDAACANALFDVAAKHDIAVKDTDWAQYCGMSVSEDDNASDDGAAYVDPTTTGEDAQSSESDSQQLNTSALQVRSATNKAKVYTVTQQSSLKVWTTHMKGRIGYNGSKTWTGYHMCNTDWSGFGYTLTVNRCGTHKTSKGSMVHYQDINVSALYQGFPMQWSRVFHFTLTKKGVYSYDTGYGF